MPLPISLSDMLQRRAAGRSRLAWFREAAMRNGGTIGDLRLRMWGEEGERAYLSVLLDDYVSPVNELRLEALIQGLWPVRSTDLAPSAIKNSAAWYAADRVENEVLLADDFDRADGPLGSVPGPGDPVAWTTLDGTVSVSGNQLSCSVQAHLSTESGAADCVVSSGFPAVNNMHYVAFRIIDVNNMLIAGYETGVNTTLRIYKRDGGAFTTLADIDDPERLPAFSVAADIEALIDAGEYDLPSDAFGVLSGLVWAAPPPPAPESEEPV